MTEVGSAYVTLIPSAKGFASKMQSEIGGDVSRMGTKGGDDYSRGFATSATGGMKARASKMFSALGTAAKVGAVAAGVALGKVLIDSVGEAREAQVVGARTDNVIKKMGASSWTSAKQIGALAGAISDQVAIDDEAIQSGENLLLTFGNLRNEAGKGNDIFDQTTGLMVDMSRAMDQDMKSSAVQLGKALNDPIKGVTALSRVGVAFTQDQKDQIKALQDSGNMLGAQKVILKEVKKEFSGAAAAMATPADHLKVTWGNVEEQIGTAIIPLLDKAATVADDALGSISDHGPEIDAFLGGVKDRLGDLWGAVQPAVQPIEKAFGRLVDQGDDVAGMLDANLIPAVKTASELIGKLVTFVDELPGPVKDFGVQAGAAAFILPKFTGAVGTMTEKVSAYTTGTEAATKRTDLLKSAAKNAAGIGGLLLLTNAFSNASDEGADFTGVLEGAVGGAGVGFAAGGPWGALIGAVGGGGLVALKAAFHETKEEAKAADAQMRIKAGFENAKQGADDLADSLKGVVNEYGEIPRAAIEAGFYGDDGKLSIDVQNLRDAGISMDTIVSATLGQKDALETVNSALDQQRDKLQANYDAAEDAFNEAFYNENGFLPKESDFGPVVPRNSVIPEDEDKALTAANDALMAFDDTAKIFGDRVTDNTQALRDHRSEVAHLAADLGVTVKEYNKFPDKVRTHFEEKGMVQNSQDAVRLIGHYKGLQSFKRIRTVATVAGVDLSAKQIIKLQHRYDLTPRQVKTLFKQEGVQLSLKGIAKIAKQQHLVRSDIKTLLEVNGVDATVKDVKRAEKQLLDTGKKSAHPEIKTDPIPAINDMHDVSRVLHDLDGDRADVYTYHHNVNLPPEGGGGGSDDPPPRGQDLTPRMSAPSLTPHYIVAGPTQAGRRSLTLQLADGTQLDAYLDERIDAKAALR